MKKKLLIPIIVGIVIVVIATIVAFTVWNNKLVTKITIDINPSIELGLTRGGKVKEITALNDDGKNIFNDDLTGKNIDKVIETLSERIIKGFIDDEFVTILIHVDGKIDPEEIGKKVTYSFNKKEIGTEIIIIKNITKEDEKIAKKYGISPAKASYINAITKEIPDASIESFINKSINELKETKEFGFYCDKDYILEGNKCLKEIGKEDATPGKVCPRHYYEYNGKCYEETPPEQTDKLICPEGRTLENDKCINIITENAKPAKYNCTKGEEKTRLAAGLTNANDGDANDIVCVDYSTATHPVSPCEATDGTESLYSGGVCYWHRAPVIADGCPGKIQVGDSCWDNATGIYICQGVNDGMTYSSKSEYCKGSVKYYDPVVTEYKCEKDFNLEGTKCTKKDEEDAQHENVCLTGYNLVDGNRCISIKDYPKEDGFVCNKENMRVHGNTCIIYEIIEAKHN